MCVCTYISLNIQDIVTIDIYIEEKKNIYIVKIIQPFHHYKYIIKNLKIIFLFNGNIDTNYHEKNYDDYSQKNDNTPTK